MLLLYLNVMNNSKLSTHPKFLLTLFLHTYTLHFSIHNCSKCRLKLIWFLTGANITKKKRCCSFVFLHCIFKIFFCFEPVVILFFKRGDNNYFKKQNKKIMKLQNNEVVHPPTKNTKLHYVVVSSWASQIFYSNVL